MDEFGSTHPTLAQDHQSNQGQLSTTPTFEMARMHGLAYSDQATTLTSLDESRLLTIPTAEVERFQDYLEYDYLIYKEWIGRLVGVLDEVTMRLKNGSIVVVEKPDELRVPSNIRGTYSWNLVQRLNRAGYRREFKEPGLSSQNNRDLTDYFYPGQHVRTTKGNLRRGKWISGAYDANIDPQGIVSNVRTVELEVEWLAPNFLSTKHGQDPTPPCILGTDVLQHGGIKKINKGRVPLQPLAKTLAAATNGDDIQYGTQVQLRGPTVPTDPYGLGDRVIPGAQLRKHDSNIWHVISTCTKVLVQWQDGSISEEASVSVIPKTDMDVNDMWPGDKVSLRADETTTSTPISGAPASEENGRTRSDHTVLHAHTVGVVQSVNAVERLAKVRWFQNANFKLDTDEYSQWFRALPSSTYGCMTEITSEVSLYDISVYIAFYPKLGDLAVACPTVLSPDLQLADCFGKVVELCLNGEVIIRCSAASQPHDIRVSISKLTMIATADLDGEDENGDSVSRSEENVQRRNGSYDDSPEPIAVLVEYEGGENMDLDDDEDAWDTDDSVTSATKSTYEDANEEFEEVSEHLLAQAAAPSPFTVLEDDLPTDQYFSGELQTACAEIGRKAMKEHKIMRSSLPDGVFVRTWESRLDLFRILIVGPVGTPYEYAPFLFDLQLAATFPDVPPKVFFHSWTNSLGRINPNLYEDGKVCLSLLGTWPADEKNEGWSRSSTVLQILVSIMGLILVREPYYSKFLISFYHPFRNASMKFPSNTLNLYLGAAVISSPQSIDVHWYWDPAWRGWMVYDLRPRSDKNPFRRSRFRSSRGV